MSLQGLELFDLHKKSFCNHISIDVRYLTRELEVCINSLV